MHLYHVPDDMSVPKCDASGSYLTISMGEVSNTLRLGGFSFIARLEASWLISCEFVQVVHTS